MGGKVKAKPSNRSTPLSGKGVKGMKLDLEPPVASSERKELRTHMKFRSLFGTKVPRQVFRYQDGHGDVFHALVKGRTRDLLYVRKGHQFPEWLELLDAAVKYTERHQFEIAVPRGCGRGIRGEASISMSPAFFWTCEDGRASFSHGNGYLYCKGMGDTFLYVRITYMIRGKYWDELVKSFKEQVAAARRGEKVYGIGD